MGLGVYGIGFNARCHSCMRLSLKTVSLFINPKPEVTMLPARRRSPLILVMESDSPVIRPWLISKFCESTILVAEGLVANF